MSETEFDYRDCDREIWEEELDDFVPARILDAHIHFYWRSDFPGVPSGPVFRNADLATLNRWAEVLYPGRRMQYLILEMPKPKIDIAKHIESVRSQIENIPGIRHNRMITPTCKLDNIEQNMKHQQFINSTNPLHACLADGC